LFLRSSLHVLISDAFYRPLTFETWRSSSFRSHALTAATTIISLALILVVYALRLFCIVLRFLGCCIAYAQRTLKSLLARLGGL